MRLFEFDDTINASVMGLLAHLSRKANGQEGARVRTKSFLNMLRNLGVNVDAQGLNNLKEKNPAIANLIGSIDDEYVSLDSSTETQDDGFDDLDMSDALDDGEMDDMDLDMGDGDFGGPTTDDFEQPDIEMDDAVKAQNTVGSMAKRALSRRS